MADLGVDISNNNGQNVNIEAMAASCTSVILKATEHTNYADPYFIGWARRLSGINRQWGAYHFAQPGRGASGSDEARFFCDRVESAEFGAPWRAVLDLEVTQADPQATTVFAIQWLDYVALRWPNTARTTYTYPSFCPKFVPDPALARTSSLWIAAYPYGYSSVPNPDTVRRQAPIAPWDHWAAWQYTSIANVPGVGRCDQSITTAEWHGGGVTGGNMAGLTTDEHAWLYGNTLRSIDLYNRATGMLTMTMPAAADAFVEGLYEKYLGRASDPSGKKSWVDAIVNGMDPAKVEAYFAASPEAKSKVAA